MAGQSIMDRVVAARHSIAGQGLAKSVCKATTEEIIGPKQKHLHYLQQCTNEPNVSIPQLANLMIERTQHQSWVVVFKSLVSIHNLMNYGNERFTQFLASNNCSFNLSGFVDKGGVQGYDMSTYIRRYAKYLNEKAVSYRLMAFDFCRVKRGKEDGLLRTMNTDKLLKTLPVLQQQLDSLLEFDCTPNELTNGVITACFMLLFKDLIRLFACYNDGIINLLEKFFDMNKKQCKDGLDLYKKFLVRMDKVSEFLKVAENMGIDKGDIPDLAKDEGKTFSSMVKKAPASLLDALEQHLAQLEGKKGVVTTPTGTSKPAGFASALNTMTTNTFNVSEAEKKKILEEETQYLQKLKAADDTQPGVELAEEAANENIFEQKGKEATSPQGSAAASNNPFAVTPPTSSPQANLFGSPTDPAAPPTSAASGAKASDDLLSLAGNPFMDNVQSAMASAYSQPAASSNPFGSPDFPINGFAATASSSSGFTSEADFAKAFSNGGTNTQAGSGFQTVPTMPGIPNAPPGLELGSPLGPLAGSGGQTVSPVPALPSEFGAAIPPAPSALGGPFSELEAGMEPRHLSPAPSPVGGIRGPGAQPVGVPSPLGADPAGLFGVSAPQQPFATAGLGGPATMPQGGGYFNPTPAMVPGMPVSGGVPPYFSQPVHQQSVPIPVPGSRSGMGAQAPGSPSLGMGMGVGGSPVRLMTRGGKSPVPLLSSSPSGPGLEDAVKALGLTMSPAKGVSGSKPKAAGGPSMSPGQATVGGGSTGLSSSQGVREGVDGGNSASGSCQGGPEMDTAQVPGQGFDAFGDVLTPMNKTSPTHAPQPAQQAKSLGGDLDTSLASLASNLSVSGGASQMKKDHQWQPKADNKLTGGNSFQRQPIAQSTTWGQPGFQQPTMMAPAPGAPMMYNQPMGGAPMPMMGMGQPMGMHPTVMGAPAQGMYMGQQPMPGMVGFQQPPQQQQGPGVGNVNDPFGAL